MLLVLLGHADLSLDREVVHEGVHQAQFVGLRQRAHLGRISASVRIVPLLCLRCGHKALALLGDDSTHFRFARKIRSLAILATV
jgi:hypothetical protein